MPATKPGSLTPVEVTQLIAYILDSNSFPAGKTELPADPIPLKTISHRRAPGQALNFRGPTNSLHSK